MKKSLIVRLALAAAAAGAGYWWWKRSQAQAAMAGIIQTPFNAAAASLGVQLGTTGTTASPLGMKADPSNGTGILFMRPPDLV